MLLRPSEALLGAERALSQAIQRSVVANSDYDATTINLLVHLALDADHRLRAATLCRRLQLSPSHVSRMLDRLEAAELVVRQPDPQDRRASLIVLTSRGQGVVDQVAPGLRAVLDEVIHGALTVGEVDALVDYLGRIEIAARNYREAPPT